jgi:hypothetical protein
VLLAVYGPVGVLGYGLHALWGHEHVGHSHAAEGHACCDEHAAEIAIYSSDDHDCSICDFLAQAQSQFTFQQQVAVGSLWIVAQPLAESPAFSLTRSPYPVRGPPLG